MFSKLNKRIFIKLIIANIPYLFLFSNSVFAQSGNSINFKIRQISQTEGLSSTIVTSVLNDKVGFMWFGTQDGLNQYDGYSFKTYRYDSKDTNTISDNIIQTLYQDSEGIIWIGGAVNGLSSLNTNTNKIRRYKFNNELIAAGQGKIVSIVQDKNGVIWVGSKSKGLYYSDPSKTFFTKLKLKERQEKSEKEEESDIYSLNCDKDNNIWISDELGLYKLNYKNNPNDYTLKKVTINNIGFKGITQVNF
jgi:ligand-binding sensor domain-containing protein